MAGGLLALVVAAAFTVVLLAIADLRDDAEQPRHSEEVLAAANNLERLVIDLETGQRGFILTGEERFLDPWERARAAFPVQAQALQRLTAAPHTGHDDDDLARHIADAGASYIKDYSVPTVEAARRDPASVRTVAVTDEGRRRVDAIRAEFDKFEGVERGLAAVGERQARGAARRAVVAASAGIGGSIVLVVVFTGYLTRVIVRPIRRAAAMAVRLEVGDFAARMPETGPGEIGGLERSLNSMAASLQASREELRRIGEEQAALRRVATLVAKDASPTQVFAAVAEEVGRLLGGPSTRMVRYQADQTVTVVAAWSAQGIEIPVGSRLSLDGDSVSASVLRTGRASRMDTYVGAPGALAAQLRELGLRSAIGSPIVVQGRLWGAVIADRLQPEPFPAGTENRLADFTELAATAIANADSLAQLAASRARVVAAADESRRRLERDLHDGIQQRLVSLALDLRTAEASVPSDLTDLRTQLADVGRGMGGAVEELREISRGLHPAVLTRGGLAAALKTLARRSAVPVKLQLAVEPRFPEPVEVAAYYVVSEALTNVAKHARATVVHIEVDADDDLLRLSVQDDGVGGADPARGSGLVGLKDRVESLGGTIAIVSPAGGGTSLVVRVPAVDPGVSTAG